MQKVLQAALRCKAPCSGSYAIVDVIRCAFNFKWYLTAINNCGTMLTIINT